MHVLVIADTHNKLPQQVVELARKADEIWHLGDVCEPTITLDLEKIGPPLTVVRGNCDCSHDWPMVVDLARDGLKFRLVHIPPEVPPEDVDVVLHGHTHVPRNEKRRGVLFLNPGCVTRPNRGSPASVGWLEIRNGKTIWRLLPLT
jgi:uncharacterized protein